jgi:hypothetical protein
LRPERGIGLAQIFEQSFLRGRIDGADRLQFGQHVGHLFGRIGVFGKCARDATQSRIAGDDFFNRRGCRELAPFARRSQVAIGLFAGRTAATELRERASTLRAGFFG